MIRLFTNYQKRLIVTNVTCWSKDANVYIDHVYIIHVKCANIIVNHHLQLHVECNSIYATNRFLVVNVHCNLLIIVN